MKILVTNDDGVFAPGMWEMVKALRRVAPVVVAAPDREQSATGTAVTLRQSLRAQRVRPLLPRIPTFAVEGTPSDSVILAVEKLFADVGMVISGINQGANLGEDVLISGTVGAALQGYLRRLPAIAVSLNVVSSPHLNLASRLVALVVQRIQSQALPRDIFLNINLPDLPLAEIKGIRITRLARQSHLDTVAESYDWKHKSYRLVRQRADNSAHPRTDIWALERGFISITPLHRNLFFAPAPAIPHQLGADLFQELKQG